MQRLMAPPEYRNLRGFGVTRIAGGSVAAAAGIVRLSYEAYGWAAFFLVVTALISRVATGISPSLAPYLPVRGPRDSNERRLGERSGMYPERWPT
jgi:hypothetical protein